MTLTRSTNLHLPTDDPSASPRSMPRRVEQKFYIEPARVAMALALLRRCCRSDPEHPNDNVNSVYFDTPALDQHEASASGESVKDKVRIRWYGNGPDPHSRTAADPASGTSGDETTHIWLELKSRRGFASTKQRAPMTVSADALAPRALERGIVDPRTLLETVVGFGFFPQDRLIPVVAISYWRHRLVEPWTGFRVSLDSRIRSTMLLRGHGWGERGLRLPGAVIEVKGDDFALPPSLLALTRLGTSWTRYSKYSSSLDAHAAPLGEVSRLWPSGLLDPASGPLARVARACQESSESGPCWVPPLSESHETE